MSPLFLRWKGCSWAGEPGGGPGSCEVWGLGLDPVVPSALVFGTGLLTQTRLWKVRPKTQAFGRLVGPV